MKNIESIEYDTFQLPGRELRIYFVGHGTLMMQYGSYTLHIDPVSDYADYSTMPKADLILITHQHFDHLEKKAVEAVSKTDTKIYLDEESEKLLKKGDVLRNGDDVSLPRDISIHTVPAYNTSPDRTHFHPRGRDNGYIISFGNFRVYIAGDTEPVPEMENLGHIDVAFLPMNQPYTMTPEQAAAAAAVIKPVILYPYHFGTTETSAIVQLMESSRTEVRIRSLE